MAAETSIAETGNAETGITETVTEAVAATAPETTSGAAADAASSAVTLGDVTEPDLVAAGEAPEPELGDPASVVAPPGDAVRWSAPLAAPAPALVEPEPNGANARTGPRTPDPTIRPRGSATNGWKVAAVIGLIVAWLLISAVVLLWGKVDDLNGNVAHSRAQLSGASYATADQLAALQKSVTDLGTAVARLDAATNTNGANAATELAGVKTRVDQVAGCVNAYMDVLRRWSTATNRGTITYTPC
jgi:hypothetical protein